MNYIETLICAVIGAAASYAVISAMYNMIAALTQIVNLYNF